MSLKNLCFRSLLILWISLGLVTSSCSSHLFTQSRSFYPKRASMAGAPNTQESEQIDREFKIKDFDKEHYNDKIGYVILGIAGAALTAAAIAVPIVLATKK